jgi:hypothetical protein
MYFILFYKWMHHKMEYGVPRFGQFFIPAVNGLDLSNPKNFPSKNHEFGSGYFKVYDIPSPVLSAKNTIPHMPI